MTVIESLEIIDVTTSFPDVDHLIGYSIDFPKPGDLTVGSRLEIIGWVLGRQLPVVVLEFVHGGQVLFRSPLTIERPDVAAIYPYVPWAKRSGFHASVHLLSTPVQEIHVRAVLDDLTRTDFAVVQLRRSWSEGVDSQVPLGMNPSSPPSGEVDILTTGWDAYWREWQSNVVDPLPGLKTRYPGDEWTVEDDGDGQSPYGLDTAVVGNFDTYMRNRLTHLGWLRFERYLEGNTQERVDFSAFGVMCPEMMARFLQQLQFEVITMDVGMIPRDAVAVFRQQS